MTTKSSRQKSITDWIKLLQTGANTKVHFIVVVQQICMLKGNPW